MELSAGAIPTMSPELNIDSPMQLLNVFGLDQTVVTGSADKDASMEDFETIMIQVLQQDMARLLQSAQQTNSPGLTAKEDLFASLKKPVPEDLTDAGELLSGLTLSMLARKSDGFTDDGIELLEEIIPGSKAEKEIKDILNAEMKGDTVKTKAALFLNENEILISKTMGLPSDKNISQKVVTAELNAEDGVIDLSDKTKTVTFLHENEPLISKIMGLPSDKNISQEVAAAALNAEHEAIDLSEKAKTTLQKVMPNHAEPVYGDRENKGSTSKQDQAVQSRGLKADSLNGDHNASDRQRLAAEPFKATDTTERQIKTLTGTGDGQKEVLIDGETQTPPLHSKGGMSEVKQPWADSQSSQSTQLKNVDRTLVTERMTGENQSAKAVNFIKGIVRDIPSTLNPLDVTPAEDNDMLNYSETSEQGQKVKNASGSPDILNADKKVSFLVDDTQKNGLAGKAAVPISEAAGLMDRVRTDYRNKVVSGEKKIESDILNSPIATGLHSTKITKSDMPPAQTIERISVQLNEMAAGEGGRVKITLTPPSLGSLEMDVMVRNGAVKVMLIADNKEVQQMLSGNLDSLKGSLQNQGLIIERCDVMMHNRHEQYSQGFNQQQAFNQDQRAHYHYDDVEGYSRNKEENIPIKINPMHPSMGAAGKISLFV